MRTLHRLGLWAGTVLVAVGIALSLVSLQFAVVLLVLILTGLVAGTLRYACSDGEEPGWSIVRSAAVTSAVVLAVCSYAAVLGSTLWAVPALGAIAGIRYLVGRGRKHPPVDEPALLSNHDICTAWRRSYPTLQRAVNTEQRQRIVAQRQAYLDELARRQPDAFVQWLETAPHPASDPERFFDHS